MLAALDSDDSNERAMAAIELAANGVSAAKPKLHAMCGSDDLLVAAAAMYANWTLGEDRVDVVRLIKAMGSSDESTMQIAAHTVAAIGEPMVPKFSPCLKTSPEDAALVLRALDDIHTSTARDAITDWSPQNKALQTERQSVLDDWDA